MSVFGYIELQDVVSLFKNGQNAQAVMIEMDYIPSQNTGGTTKYIPVVQWITKDQKTIEVRANFSTPQEKDYKIGQSFSVVYDPKKPATRYYVMAHGDTPKTRITDYVVLIIGAVFSLGGISMILVAARQ